MGKELKKRKSATYLMDFIELTVYALLFVLLWRAFYRNQVYFFRKGNYVVALIYWIQLFIFMHIYNGFSIGQATVGNIILSQAIAVFFTDFLMYFEIALVAYRFLAVSGFWWIFLIQVASVIGLVLLLDTVFYSSFKPVQTLLFYSGNPDNLVSKLIRYQGRNIKITDSIQITGTVDDVLEQVGQAEQIMISGLPIEQKAKLVTYCYEKEKQVIEVPSIYEILLNKGIDMHLVDTPLIQVNQFGPSQLSKEVKRLSDIVLSLLALIILAPLFLITFLAVKLSDGGPAFYRQTRLTQYGRKFQIIKFRSMKVNAEADGKAVFAKENDNRVTKVGKVIRKCRLDELPQLINILRGDMSFVGPRPERPEIAAEIRKTVPEFDLRLMMKAGLTGYAQVYGKYNTDLKDKLLLDLQYIEDFSLVLDLKLILMTFKTLFIKDSTEGV